MRYGEDGKVISDMPSRMDTYCSEDKSRCFGIKMIMLMHGIQIQCTSTKIVFAALNRDISIRYFNATLGLRPLRFAMNPEQKVQHQYQSGAL